MLKKNQLYFFFGFLAVMGLLALYIALPYLQAIVLAAALAVVCWAPYQWLVGKWKFKGLAALTVILGVALIIFIPFSFVGVQIVNEATTLYNYISTHGLQDILQSSPAMSHFLSRFSPDTLSQPQDILKNILNWLIGSAGVFFSSTVIIFLNAIICIFALYYFLRDGERLRQWVLIISPLPNKYDVMILDRLGSTISSVVGGYLVIAALQGLCAGIGFAIFGVPNAVLWGSLAAILSLIPAVGMTIIFVPAIFFLFFQSHVAGGIGLWIWWLLMIGLIDNLLTPRVVNRGARIHPFAIFIAVIGGISVFGPLGLLIGPLVFSLFFTLLDIYLSFREAEAPKPAKPATVKKIV